MKIGEMSVWFGSREFQEGKSPPRPKDLFYWKGEIRDAEKIEMFVSLAPIETRWEATLETTEQRSMSELINFKRGQSIYLVNNERGRPDIWHTNDVVFIFHDCVPVSSVVPFFATYRHTSQDYLSVSLRISFYLSVIPGKENA